ncbi:vWA domain-containing protein [Cohnella yongneupensis]|uniref:VWA domain-containing protein n=1 Tax=Cohnella yongneupensis TaxID=425006 RepID=A0ABW0R076_9BACL
MQPLHSSSVTFTHCWNRPYLPTGGAGKCYLLLEARGHGEVRADRAPINVSLVLDRSGSMSGKPLAYSKRACQYVVDQMNEGDVLSLVAFDDEVWTVVPPAPVTVANKYDIKQRIERIRSGSCTNLSGGLMEGSRHVLAGKNDRPRAVNRVILLSDGHANQGITSKERLAEIAREYHGSGVGISTMGVGDRFDEELMETISYQGGGNFYYIDTPERIPVIFQEELEGMLSVVANRMTLTLRTTDRAAVTNVYGYATERCPGELKISAGDLYGNEVKAILVELTVAAHSPGRHPVLTLEWEYTDLMGGAKSACAYHCEVHAEFTADSELLNMNGDVKVLQQVEFAQSAKAIESAMEAMDRGDLQAGQQMLREQADQLRMMSDALEAPALAEASEKLFARLDDNFEYSSRTRKELHEQKYKQLRRK